MKYSVQSGIGSIARAVCARVSDAFARCLGGSKSGRGVAASVAVAGALMASSAASGQVVISQVAAGATSGTLNGSAYQQDYVELYNRGQTAISLSGWSVQYASSSGAFSGLAPLPPVSLNPGQYFLVQVSSFTLFTGNGVALPTPDRSPTGSPTFTGFDLSSSSGKVALVSSATLLSSGTPTNDPTVIDFVGYGSANWNRTSSLPGGVNNSINNSAASGSNLNAIFRSGQGATDVRNNAVDFTPGVAQPRNSVTPVRIARSPVFTRVDSTSTAATPNGVLASDEYGLSNSNSFTGGGAGFSGELGAGRLNFKSDASNLYMSFQPGAPVANYTIVYIDSRVGGFDDASMSDAGDAIRNAITNPGSGGLVNFPSGFGADYAIVIEPASVAWFQLTGGSLTFLGNDTNIWNVGNNTSLREISIPLSTLGMTAGQAFAHFALATSSTRFLSNETIPAIPSLNSVANPGSTAGSYPVTITNFNRFIINSPTAGIIAADCNTTVLATSTVDGTLSVNEYSSNVAGGSNTGFGGILTAASNVRMISDGVRLKVGFQPAGAGFADSNNAAVMFLDTRLGGFQDTNSIFSDISTKERRAATRPSASGNVVFPANFLADYAVVYSDGGTYVFELSSTAAPTLVAGTGSTANGGTFSAAGANALFREFEVPLNLIGGTSAGSHIGYFMLLCNGNNGFMADESIPANILPGGNPGFSGASVTNYSRFRTSGNSLLPIIMTQPGSALGCTGQTVSSSVVVQPGNGNILYQWFKTGVAYPGQTNSTFLIPVAAVSDTTTLSNTVVITRPCGTIVTSALWSVSVADPAIFTTQPVNATQCGGGTTTFTVAATPTGAVAFQWQQSTDGGTTWVPANGTGTATAMMTTSALATNGTLFRCRGSTPAFAQVCALFSNTAALTVIPAPVITAQPTNQSAALSGSINLSVTATGTSLSYQWQRGTANLNVGTNSSTYSVPVASAVDFDQYRVIVTGSGPCSVTSGNAIVTQSGNDACGTNQAAFTVPPNGGLLTGTLVGATNDGNASCQNNAAADVYYYFTPSSSGTWTIQTCNAATGFPDVDTAVSIHFAGCPVTATVGSLAGNQIAATTSTTSPGGCRDQGCTGNLSFLNANLVAGTAYTIRVAMWSTTATPAAGPFQLRVDLTAPSNDLCTAAIDLGSVAASAIARTNNTLAATGLSNPTTTICGTSVTRDVWYKFTTGASPAGANPWVISTCGSGFDTYLEVFSGVSCPSTATTAPIASGCNDNIVGSVPCSAPQSAVSVSLTASTTYYVRIAAANASLGGNVQLNIGISVATNPTGTSIASPASVAQGCQTLLTVTPIAGLNPTSTVLAVTANLTGFGGSATQQMFDNATNGDAVAGDGIFSYRLSVSPTQALASVTPTFTVTDAQARTSGPLNFPAITTIGYLSTASAAAVPSGVPADGVTTTNLSITINPVTPTGGNVCQPAGTVTATINLTAIGGAASVPMTVTGTGPWTATLTGVTVPLLTPAGSKSLAVSVSDSLARTASGTITLSVVPANDECSNAIALAGPYTGPGVTQAGSLAGATSELNQFSSACVSGVMGTKAGVWYSIIGSGRQLRADLCQTTPTFDSLIQVFSGSCGALTCVSGNDDSTADGCSGNLSNVNFSTVAGQQYFVWVGPFTSPSSNTFQLRIIDISANTGTPLAVSTTIPAPGPGAIADVETCAAASPGLNDGCDQSPNNFQDITFASGNFTGAARASATSPAFADRDWFRFQATAAQTVLVTAQAQFPLDLSLRQLGAAGICAGATTIQSQVVAGGAQASISASVISGNWYAVRIANTASQGFICSPSGSNYVMSMQVGAPTSPSCVASTSPSSVSNDGSGAATLTVVVTPGANPASISHTVTANLLQVGGGAAVAMTEGPTNTFTLSIIVPAANPSGPRTIAVSVTETAPLTRTSSCSATLIVTPANDVCGANPALFTIPASGGSVSGDLAGASSEGNAASSCQSGTGQRDLFYYFTPATSCGWTFSTCGGVDVDTIISIHSACPTPLANNQLTPTASSCGDQGCGSGNLTLLNAPAGTLTAGTPYIIRVAGWSSSVVTGTFTMTVTPAGPANDLCANATLLTVTSGSAAAAGDSSCATTALDPAVAPPSCLPAATQDVWYTFTTGAAQAGPWIINTCGSSIDTVLTLYSGATCAALTEVACNDNAASGSCAGPRSEITTNLLAGTAYRVRLSSGAGSPAGGNFTLNVIFATPPSNDNCPVPSVIVATGGTVTGNTTYATLDGPSTTTLCSPTLTLSKDVWFSFSPTTAGNWRFSTCGSASDTVLSLWSACPASSGIALACSDDFGGTCGTGSQFDAMSLAAGTYLVRVSNKSPSIGGAFTLTVSVTPPANDLCAAAQVISPNSVTQGTNIAATAEVGLPTCAGLILPSGNTVNTILLGVWYKVTPTADGTITADTITDPTSGTVLSDTDIFAFTGTCGALNCVIANDDLGAPAAEFRSKIAFRVLANTDYYILVGPDSSSTGTFALTTTFNPTPSNDSCSTPLALSPNSGTLSGTTVGATADNIFYAAAPTTCTNTNAFFDVWYSYTPTCTGVVTFDTCGAFDTIMSLHSACPTAAVSNQIGANCNSDGVAPCTPGSRISSFPVIAGTTYLLRVAGQSGFNPGGAFTLTWAGPAELPSAPTSVSSSTAAFCANAVSGNITLSAIGGGGTSLNWFSGSCNVTPIGTGNSLSIAAPATTTTYFANYQTACGISGCASVTVTVQPAPTASAGSVATVCQGGSVTLAGSGSNAASFAWSAASGTFSNASSLTSSYTPSATSGSIVLTLTANGVSPCANATSTVTINITPAPTASAGSTATVCAGGVVTLAGSASNALSFAWSAPSGTFSNTVSLTSTYTPTITSGSVVLTLTAQPNSPCATPAISTVTINVTPAATVSAGSASTILANAAATLNGSGTNATFLWSGGAGTFANATSPATTYTPGPGDIGNVVLTLTATGTAPCGVVSSTVTITVRPVFVTLVAVNPAYAALPSGTPVNSPPNGLPGPYAVGITAFGTIQSAIDAVDAGGTVNVAPGTYLERPTINKSITLLGANAGIDACTGTRLAESIVIPDSGTATLAGTTGFVSVTASNVTINGFTFDGDNPALTSPFTANGANPDVDTGISTEGATAGDNLVITNNIIKNIFQFGVAMGSTGGPAKSGRVDHNRLDNIPYWAGVLVYDDYYAVIDNNCINNAWRGVQTNNFYQANPSATAASISNNTITTQTQVIAGDATYTDVGGILVNLHYAGASPWQVSGNTISNLTPRQAGSDGIILWSIQTATVVGLSNNAVTAFESGYELWNCPTSSLITITGGTVTACGTGVTATNFSSSWGDAESSKYILSGLTVTGSTGTAVSVIDSPLNTNGATVGVTIQSASSLTGNGTGITVSGTDAAAMVKSSVLTGNTVAALAVTGGGKLDAGDCTNSNFTGLGTSTGGNTLTGYGFDSAAPFAVSNANLAAQPAVFATGNTWGNTAVQAINTLLLGNGGANSAINTNSSFGPGIITQPIGGAVCSPATLLLTSAAVNATSVQWRLDGNPIVGANSASYLATLSGSYDAVYTDFCGGTTTTDAAAVIINPATAITSGPSSSIICEGSNASFSVIAAGTGLNYQWNKNGLPISGETMTTYSIPAASIGDAGSYTVTVTGTCGSLTSAAASLTVNPSTVIVTGPANTAACVGQPASFTVSVSGAGLNYQWFKNAVAIPGAISASYPIPAASVADAGSYTVTVTGACGSLTSAAASLTVNSNTVITTSPLASTLCEGQPASFTVAATGTGLSYQWKKNGNVIGGATSATYSIPAVTAADAGSYTVAVTGTCGTLTSAAAALVVNTSPSITTQPASVAACLSSPATLTVVATGTGLTYQWKLNGTDIGGATSASYSIPSVAAPDAGSYTVVITGTCGSPITSSPAVLTVGGGTAVVFVDDDYTGLPSGTVVTFPMAGGSGSYTIGCNAFATIQGGITAVDASGTVNVAAGSYIEDVSIAKSLSLLGNSAATVTVSGAIGGPNATLAVGASNVTIKGFTITRQGNNPTDWNSALNTAGVAVQGTGITGLLLADCVLTGNRSAIDLNNTGGHTVRNNIITNNRTGMILRNQTNALTISENEITNNWTVGILFLDGSGTTNSPPQQASGSTFSNNNLSGNWYGQIVDRQIGGSIPAPGTNIKNFSANWLGTASPVISSANSAEPGYAAQIPVIFGGAAVPPGGQPDVLGLASANFDITPLLSTGTDTDLSGSGDIFGFQGDFAGLTVTAQLAQTGSTGRIQEGHDLVTAGGTVNVNAGSYAENVVITKLLKIIGAGSGGGGLTGNPATDTIVAPASGAGFTIDDVGGVSAANRLSISNLRIQGPGSSIGIRVLAATGQTRSFFRFDNIAAIANSNRGLSLESRTVGGGLTQIDVTNSFFNNSGNQGIANSDLAVLSGLRIDGCTFSGNFSHGVYIGGVDGSFTPTNITLANSTFTDNGSATQSGTGHISFFWFNGNANLSNLSLSMSGSSVTRQPLQFRGWGSASAATWQPLGNVSLSNVTISGRSNRPAAFIQRYSSLANFSLSNVNLAGVISTNAPGGGFATAMQLTHTGATPVALNNTVFPCQGAGYFSLFTESTGGAAADCTTVFIGATTLAQKEACVLDVNDIPGVGDVTFTDAGINVGGQPSGSVVCSGSAASFSVAATNATGYQWYKDLVLIPGATAATYSIPAATLSNAGSYTVIITGLCGNITSDAATLTVNPGTVIVTNPSSSTVCEGVATGFAVSATGTGLSYQWSKNAVAIFGATSASYLIPAASIADAGSYTVTVTGTCGSLTSAAASLTVNTAPTIGAQPSGSTVCTGDPTTFSVTATGTGLAYQWKKNGNPILAATAATYTIPATTPADSASYTVTITGTCGTLTSSPAVLTVNSSTAITSQPSGSTVCAGQPASFTVAATGTGLAYQWYKDGNSISGASAATYSIPVTAAADAASYTVTITGSCGVLTSSPAVLAVNTAPALSALSTSSTVCTGGSFTLSVTATGTAPFSYQWFKDGNPITLANANSYSIPAVAPSNAGTYSVQVTNVCGTAASNTHVLTVGTAPVISGQPAPSSTAVGGIATFTVTATATPGPISYQWRRAGVNLPNAGVYSGVNTPTLTINPATLVVAGTFDCVVTAPCGVITSNPALLSVGTAPSITSQPNPVLARVSECITFTSSATGAPTLTYQWFRDGLPLSNGGGISGATTTTLSICPVTGGDAGNYTMVATNAYGNATSNPAALTINPACNCADIVTTPGLPPGDGILDGNDFIAFINAFAADDPAADIASSEGCGPDGTVDGNDFVLFINQFAEGC